MSFRQHRWAISGRCADCGAVRGDALGGPCTSPYAVKRAERDEQLLVMAGVKQPSLDPGVSPPTLTYIAQLAVARGEDGGQIKITFVTNGKMEARFLSRSVAASLIGYLADALANSA